MEKEIYELIKNIYIKNYKDNDKNIINDKVLNEFVSLYFLKYKDILFDNALIYSLRKNDNIYLNIINKYNIVFKLNNDENFKLLTIKYALYNIYDKLIRGINEDEDIKNKYKDIFNYKNSSITTISALYRKWIINLINSKEDKEIYEILDTVFYSTNFDNELIKISSGFLNINNIKKYKIILFRLILFDDYLHLKSLEKEEEIDNKVNEIYSKYHTSNEEIIEEYSEEVYDEYHDYEYELESDEEDLNDDNFDDENRIITKEEIEVLNFINEFLESNKLNIEEFKRIRKIFYNTFAWYNLEVALQRYDIDTIKDDKEIIKNLKKINPLYSLDSINWDN